MGYIKEREISFLFFLLLVLLVIVLWNLYKKEKKRAELEGYMDQLDDDSEECIQAGLLVVVT